MRPPLVILALVLVACGSPAVSAAPSAATGGDPTGAWQLAFATVDGRELGLIDDHPITAVL
jgi:hypothetical protein